MNMMSKEQAKEFASKWLPAWTGNDPEKLLSFYSDDAFYLDPAIPNGIKGKEELKPYFNETETGVKSTLDPCCKLLQELIMSRPLRIQFPDAWYHVMTRGRRGEKVFEGKNDYNAFIDLLKELVENFNVNIAAYCLLSKETLKR